MTGGIDKLQAKKEKQEEVLKKLRERIRRAEALETTRERKKDTRRKILVGAMILERMKKDPDYQGQVLKSLDRFLFKPNDRELFGLPVRESKKAEAAVDAEKTRVDVR
ncbi:hypothetical protein ACFL6C_01980 [Myxococcota bacterium]